MDYKKFLEERLNKAKVNYKKKYRKHLSEHHKKMKELPQEIERLKGELLIKYKELCSHDVHVFYVEDSDFCYNEKYYFVGYCPLCGKINKVYEYGFSGDFIAPVHNILGRNFYFPRGRYMRYVEAKVEKKIEKYICQLIKSGNDKSSNNDYNYRNAYETVRSLFIDISLRDSVIKLHLLLERKEEEYNELLKKLPERICKLLGHHFIYESDYRKKCKCCGKTKTVPYSGARHIDTMVRPAGGWEDTDD